MGSVREGRLLAAARVTEVSSLGRGIVLGLVVGGSGAWVLAVSTILTVSTILVAGGIIVWHVVQLGLRLGNAIFGPTLIGNSLHIRVVNARLEAALISAVFGNISVTVGVLGAFTLGILRHRLLGQRARTYERDNSRAQHNKRAGPCETPHAKDSANHEFCEQNADGRKYSQAERSRKQALRTGLARGKRHAQHAHGNARNGKKQGEGRHLDCNVMQMVLYQARQYGKMNHANGGQHKGSDKEDDGSYLACELKAGRLELICVLRVRHREPF